MKTHGGETLGRDALRAAPGYIVNLLAATLVAALFARWMGVEAYGGFTFAFHGARLLSVLAGLGLGQAATRLLPRYRRDQVDDRHRGFLRFGLLVIVTAGVGIGAAAYGLASFHLGASHSTAALAHAGWIVPLLAVSLFAAGVLRSAGDILLATVTTGALRDAVALLAGWVLLTHDALLTAPEALQAVGVAVAAGLVLQVPSLLRHGPPLTGATSYEPWGWLNTSLRLSYLGLARIILAAAGVLALRLAVGEAEAGSFHLASVWAGWTLVPGLALASVAEHRLATLGEDQATALIRRGLSLALLPTGLVSLAVFTLAALPALRFPDATHRLAGDLLLPVFLASGIEGLGIVLGSGLSSSGRVTPVARILTILWVGVLGTCAFLAKLSGPLAMAWGIVVWRAWAVWALWRALDRPVASPASTEP